MIVEEKNEIEEQKESFSIWKYLISFIIFCLLVLLTINFISAQTIYAGTNYTFRIETAETIYWDAVGNSSNMEGFLVHQDKFDTYSNITFEIDLRFGADNFTIILFENITNEIIKEIRVGGGSSRTKYIYKNQTIYKDVIKIIEGECEKDVCEYEENVQETFWEKWNRYYEKYYFYALSGVGVLVLIGLLLRYAFPKK